MPEADRLRRRAIAGQAAHAAGVALVNAMIARPQLGSSGNSSATEQLLDEDISLNVEDTASANYGKLYFIDGISIPGGPDVVP